MYKINGTANMNAIRAAAEQGDNVIILHCVSLKPMGITFLFPHAYIIFYFLKVLKDLFTYLLRISALWIIYFKVIMKERY